jgi:hypothetical protein
MTGADEAALADRTVITRVGEDDWRVWREVRLAALTDAPTAFGSGLEREEALPEDAWRAMARTAAIFVAIADGAAVGVVAGLPRASAEERGLGAMWVAPSWRGQWATVDNGILVIDTDTDTAGGRLGEARLRLRPLRGDDETAFRAAHQVMAAEDFTFGLGLEPAMPWSTYLKHLDERAGASLPPDRVPATSRQRNCARGLGPPRRPIRRRGGL